MNRKSFYKWGLIVAIVYFLLKILFWGPDSFYSRFESSRRLEVLQKEEQALTQENRELQEELDKVQGEGVELEKMAREEYGMQKEGEVIIKFIQEGNENE